LACTIVSCAIVWSANFKFISPFDSEFHAFCFEFPPHLPPQNFSGNLMRALQWIMPPLAG
jgi:hypothetical protein